MLFEEVDIRGSCHMRRLYREVAARGGSMRRLCKEANV
jgi:hypothetical protein